MAQTNSLRSLLEQEQLEAGAESELVVVFDALQKHIEAIGAGFANSHTDTLSEYLEKRRLHPGARKQDLLPLLVYASSGGQDLAKALPLAACWTLYLAASHMLDQAQDKQAPSDGVGVFALGLANVALAGLDADRDTLSDILDALGRVTAMGISAQVSETRCSQYWSRHEYFQYVSGKAAAIIASGAWIGGRLATEDDETLTVLKEFGLALGMAMQLSDDSLDLVEDLTNGTYTLPVIEGLAMEDHPNHPALKRLLRGGPLTTAQAEDVAVLLERMGTVALTRRMARAFQVQAAAAFEVLPDLAIYFADYVGHEP